MAALNRPIRVLITGGTDGIGREAVITYAAKTNIEVYFAGRNQNRADAVIAQCRANAVQDRQLEFVAPTFLQYDLSRDAQVVAFAKHVARLQFDVVILNHGVIAPRPVNTDDGRDATMITNVISSYIIAHTILEQRDPDRNLRLVFSTSDIVRCQVSRLWCALCWFNGADVEHWRRATRPNGYYNYKRYHVSKIGMAALSTSISKRNIPNVTATCVHPGVVPTNLTVNAPDRHQKYILCCARCCGTDLIVAGQNLVRAAEHPLDHEKGAKEYYRCDKMKGLRRVCYLETTHQAFNQVMGELRREIEANNPQ